MIGLEVIYGVSESLQPTVSKNLGARQPERIRQFTFLAMASVLILGIRVSALLVFIPESLISVFLREGENETEKIALAYIAVFWPAFLFNGANITLSSYFTALHKPLQSAAIAISRSLVLPAMGIMLLPRWFGDTGVFITSPLAEALTFGFALLLVALQTSRNRSSSGK
jgi:Na+-driven multidrug efflux pump